MNSSDLFDAFAEISERHTRKTDFSESGFAARGSVSRVSLLRSATVVVLFVCALLAAGLLTASLFGILPEGIGAGTGSGENGGETDLPSGAELGKYGFRIVKLQDTDSREWPTLRWDFDRDGTEEGLNFEYWGSGVCIATLSVEDGSGGGFLARFPFPVGISFEYGKTDLPVLFDCSEVIWTEDGFFAEPLAYLEAGADGVPVLRFPEGADSRNTVSGYIHTEDSTVYAFQGEKIPLRDPVFEPVEGERELEGMTAYITYSHVVPTEKGVTNAYKRTKLTGDEARDLYSLFCGESDHLEKTAGSISMGSPYIEIAFVNAPDGMLGYESGGYYFCGRYEFQETLGGKIKMIRQLGALHEEHEYMTGLSHEAEEAISKLIRSME